MKVCRLVPLCLTVPFLLLFATACNDQRQAGESRPEVLSDEHQVYMVRGVLKEIRNNGRVAVIDHEEIPGFMRAMTMPLEVRNPAELKKFKPGDTLSFRLVVTEDDFWIDQLQPASAQPQSRRSRPAVRVVRDVEPLEVGDLLPNYQLTNELGKVIQLSDFKGKALAMNFIFTTCPIPTVCPQMSSQFSDVQQKIKSLPEAPSNWHLLSISFDPEIDTPGVLRAYGKRFGYDPNHWSFATGSLIDVTALAEQFSQTFWTEGETLNHNIRTVVVNAQGRIQSIFSGDSWTSDQLVKELVIAASAQPVETAAQQ
jgi:protein SCO1